MLGEGSRGFGWRAAGHESATMNSNSDEEIVARVVAAISDRTDAQGIALATALAARWSPPDRHDPLALRVAPPLEPPAGPLPTAGLHLFVGPLPDL